MTGRVLVLGAAGMVGRAWLALLQREGVPFDAWTRAEFTLGDDAALARLLKVGQDVESSSSGSRWHTIVNCAAYTAVDRAEGDSGAAARVNGWAVGELARAAEALGAKLVHYSTDYVFNGQAERPYEVDASTEPLNAYGRSKLMGEEALRTSGARSLLVRTSWVYAPWGHNFVTTMSRLLRERTELAVVSDQRGRPTSAEQLARRTFQLCSAGCEGTFHLTDAGDCTWYEFATAVRDHLGLATRLRPILTEDYPTPARRPRFSVLDTALADELIGVARPWQEMLPQTLDAMPKVTPETLSND